MVISTFGVNIDKSKRLWIVIMSAVSIAAILILTAFICVYKSGNGGNNVKKEALFNINSYYAEYDLKVISNKNQNSYLIKEWYLNKVDNEKYRFDFENEEKDQISYIVSDNYLGINSNNQINSLSIDGYKMNKENLLSISTFFKLYNSARGASSGNIKVETKNIDNNVHYYIYIVPNNDVNTEEYTNILSQKINVSKIELVVDTKENLPKEYYVFNNNDEIVIGIKYNKFDIINEFDEKIFANFNK